MKPAALWRTMTRRTNSTSQPIAPRSLARGGNPLQVRDVAAHVQHGALFLVTVEILQECLGLGLGDARCARYHRFAG